MSVRKGNTVISGLGSSGRDGVIQYTAGDNIVIENNVISVDTSSIIWIGTQEEYDALSTYNENTLYFIKEDTNVSE